MGEVERAYRGCRERIGELVRGLDGSGAATPVPTCPEWSVHDLVAHVAGVVDDALAGRLDGVATEPWTAAQVEARRGHALGDIVAEWDAQAPAFEGILDAIGDPGRQAVADVVTHEHDLRLALGAPGAREADAVAIGLGFVAPWFLLAADANQVAVQVRADDGASWGTDDATVTLRGSPFELLRAMTGRRSVDELRAMDWTGDFEPALAAFTFGPFHPAAAPISE